MDTKQRGLQIQSIKGCYTKEDVNPSIYEGMSLLFVGHNKLIPCNGTIFRMFGIYDHRSAPCCRAYGSGNKASTIGVLALRRFHRPTGDLHRNMVEFGSQILKLKIGQANAIGVECVRLYDIGSRL